jgi:hypothetical protein
MAIPRSGLNSLPIPPSATISQVKPLSSYNWIEAPLSTPTIAVPGCPDLWSPPNKSCRVPKDSGLIFIAQNAARNPASPLEPLFRALHTTDPSYDLRSVELISDRNNIRKLLSFVNADVADRQLEEFTIRVEVVQNTTIFCRTATATTEFIGPREFRGFGHEFEKAFTTPQVKNSTGHHRIVAYRLADLNVVIRYEVDAYVAGPSPDLSSLLDSLSLSAPKAVQSGHLTIRREQQLVPPDLILEIKTRVSHKPLQIADVAPQLWVSQTPKLVRAYHQKGVFMVPRVEDVSDQIKDWEENNQPDLKRLVALIKKITAMVKERGGSALLKYDIKEQKLVFNPGQGKLLPNDLYSIWD